MSETDNISLGDVDLEKISGGTDWNADYIRGVMNFTTRKGDGYWSNSDPGFWQGELQYWQDRLGRSKPTSNTAMMSSQMVNRIKSIIGA